MPLPIIFFADDGLSNIEYDRRACTAKLFLLIPRCLSLPYLGGLGLINTRLSRSSIDRKPMNPPALCGEYAALHERQLGCKLAGLVVMAPFHTCCSRVRLRPEPVFDTTLIHTIS